MNKTISINLGGRNFFIEEEAYKKLDAYLGAIKARFAEYAGSGEIVADMESRIGEKFWEKRENNAQAVITISDVENLIAELGTVEDIAGEAGKKDEEKIPGQSFAPKRLMRNGDDKIIAGVCSGLAAYFNVDPFMIRLVFGILVFAWGTIIPIYLLLWLIMPEAKTATEKMQMRGEPMNLDSIGETIKERAEEFKQHMNEVGKKKEWQQWSEGVKDKAKSVGQEMGEMGKRGGRGLGGFLRAVFEGIGKVIRIFFKIIIKIIGLAFMIAMAVAIAGLTVAAATAAFNVNSPYIGLPLSGLAHTPVFYVLVASAYVLALIPLQLLLLGAVALFSGKKSLNLAAGLTMFGIWVIALAVGVSLGARYVPDYVEQIKNSPELQTVNKTFEVKDFNKIELSNSIKAKLIQGKEFNVKASGWAMDLDRLDVAASDGTLKVGRNFRNFCVFCLSGSPTVEITAPDFTSIRALNSSSVSADSILATTTALSLYNSSRANIHFEVKDLSLNLGNSSSANLSGSAEMLTAKLYNSSRLSATDLMVKNAQITTSNSSRANVNVSDNLKYDSYNSSRVYYLGSPKIETSNIQRYFQSPPLPQAPPMDEQR